MKIVLDLEQKHINALVSGLALVAAKGMNLVLSREAIREDLGLDTELPITYEELVELANNIQEEWEDDHTTEEPS